MSRPVSRFLEIAADALRTLAHGSQLEHWNVAITADSWGNESLRIYEHLEPFDAKTCPPGRTSFELGGIRWVIAERWDGHRANKDGHDLLARNKDAPTIARWMHPDELDHLWRLGVVTVEDEPSKYEQVELDFDQTAERKQQARRTERRKAEDDGT